jgi:hypothetical protein
MSKIYRYYGFILLVALIATGCKKEEIIEYPVNFYEDRIEVKSATRMFTHTGEIKDQAQIAAFIKDVPYFNAENNPMETGSPAITFLSGEELLVRDTQQKFTIQRKGKQFLFYSTESGFSSESRLARIRYDFLKHRHPQASQGSWGYISKSVLVANGNLSELKFSLLAYQIFTSDNRGSSTTSSLANNEFNEQVLATLKPGEQIAIKEYYLVCKAK